MASTLEENRVQARKFAELEQRLQDSQLTIEQRNTQIHELRRKVEDSLSQIQRFEEEIKRVSVHK